jgi:hypothetical protein
VRSLRRAEADVTAAKLTLLAVLSFASGVAVTIAGEYLFLDSRFTRLS